MVHFKCLVQTSIFVHSKCTSLQVYNGHFYFYSEGPTSADDEAARLYSPSLLPNSKQPWKPLPKKLLLLSDELGTDREF